MASAENPNSMSIVDESTIVTDEPDSQSVPQSSTASSTSSTAVPQRQPFGTGLCYDPKLFPEYEKAPASFIKTLEKFFSDKLDVFKDSYKAFLRKQATFDAARGHLANQTFPSDLCHRFLSVAQFAQTIPQDRRDAAHEADREAFLQFKIECMRRRLPLYELDVNNALAIVNSFKNQEKVEADFLTATSANYLQFKPALSWHFVEYLGRVEEVEKSFMAHHLKTAENLAAAKQASMAKLASKTAAASATAVDPLVDAASAAAAAVSSGGQNPFAQIDPVILADMFRRLMLLAPGVPPSPAAPAATFAQAAAKPAAAKPASTKPDSTKPDSTKPAFAGKAATTKANTAHNTSNAGKGPKNSSGSGGRPTNERQGRPKDERRYEDNRRYDDRSQYRQSDSNPSSRSDTSRHKRQHSPSPDRDDSRSRSRPRQSRSRRSRSRSPRRDRDDDSGRGRSQARNSSRRDSRERNSAPSKR